MSNAKLGRPKKEIDWKVIDAILEYGASLIDCAEYSDCSDDTIVNAIKEKFGCNFKEYRERKLTKIRIKLLQKQIQLALAGNDKMLKHLGEVYLDQGHKNTLSGSINIVIDGDDRNL